MLAPESRTPAVAALVIVSLFALLAARALPLPAQTEPERPAAAGASAPGFLEQAARGERAAARGSRLLPSLLGLAVAATVAAVLVLTVFKKSGYDPHIIPQDFVAGVSHAFFPLPVGRVLNYTVSQGGESATLSVTATANTKLIMGVLCLGAHERRVDAGERSEDTWRWYAQDDSGDVWQFAWETKKYDHGMLTEERSWQAGSGGAKPCRVMPGRPQDYLDKEFQYEFVPGVAESRARVLALNQSVTVAGGSFAGCVKLRVISTLEPGKEEHMFFAPGIGLVLSESPAPQGRRLELVGSGGE